MKRTDLYKPNLLLGLFLVLKMTALHAEVSPAEDLVTLEETVVTASRADQTLGDLPAHATILTRADIRRSPARTLDDFLRQVPGFSLFRRSSSAVAHPTTQGVSLRGIGASGASRTLVLLDGMPLNDPFGGWVQWSKVRLQHLERVEVLRGGGAHIWGNYALGGVIHLSTPQPREGTLALSASGGDRETADLDFVAARRFGGVGLGLEGAYFTTGGYPIVRPDQRGIIDEEANSENQSLRIKLSREFSEDADLFLHAGGFDEKRGNGTPLTKNSTRAGYAGARLILRTADKGRWTLTGFAQVQQFESAFSSQAADRSSERLALDQFEVPSSALGASLEWLKPLGAHLLTAGSDFRRATGETNEDFRNLTGRFTRRRQAGGDQQLVGFYLQDIFAPAPRWQLTVGGRVDHWRSFSGQRREEDLENPQTLRDDTFAERRHWIVNPKAGLRFHATDHLSLRGALYRTFRAPTLNELFRPFRVRNDITEANPDLDPERLHGAEIGVDLFAPSLRGRLTGYWNRVEDPIFNLTLAANSTGAVINPCGFVPQGGSCRQRHNLERARIRGLEAELNYHKGPFWRGSLRYLFTHGGITAAPARPILEGKRLPQVPAHRLVLQLGYARPTLVRATLQGRYLGKQYEDDINTLELGDFAVVDLSLARPLKTGTEVFLRVENLLDQFYAVGRASSGIVTEGAPRLFHGGLRAQF